MTRLIDADALMDTIIHRAYSVTDYWNSRDAGMFLYGIEQAVNEQPTVDAVPVIRCKDCKYCSVDRRADGNVPDYVCIEMDCGVGADGFCSWAERKEEFDCNDCYYSMQNCKDRSICCEDETALCDNFEPVEERKEE